MTAKRLSRVGLWTLAATLAAFGLAAPGDASVPPPPPKPVGAHIYSEAELSSTPPPELASRMLSELGGRMVEYRPELRRFYARPTARGANLCQALYLSPSLYAAGGPGVQKGSVWVHSVATGYSYHRLPRADRTWEQAEKVCSELQPGFSVFSGPVPEHVGIALRLLDEATLSSRQDQRPTFKVDCSSRRGRCNIRTVLQGLDAAEILELGASTCDRGICYRFTLRWAEGSVGAVVLHSRSEPGSVQWGPQVLTRVEIVDAPAG